MMKHFGRLAAVSLAVALTAGCSTTTVTDSAAVAQDQSSHALKSAVPQDPALRLTTAEVMNILAGADADNYVLIDSRPATKFLAGHVPGAISIPKAKMQQQLATLPKDKTLVFYCGGLNCPLSPAAAKMAMANGFSKVKVWYEGSPGWAQAGNYSIIETKGLQKLQTSNKPFVLVDSRPAMKFQQAFIPGAVSLPKAEFPRKKHLLPGDKSTMVVFYCGGYHCQLSHQSAKMAIDEGYSKVSVYAAGSPEWKQAGLPMWGSQGSAGMQTAKTGLAETIEPAELTQLMAAGNVTIVDVRTAEEYAAGHLPGAVHVFDEDFIYKSEAALAKLPASGRVVLVCASGARAGGAYATIQAETNYANKAKVQYLDSSISYAADGSYTVGQ
ncbi:rhodanese-like domain-containing protein [Ferrimonas lipolytica]|uniref:Rhodanese-like domain-containing protein n=1 Tax=Ferrimonas lipolytica TaxID=2724191 RepID=A0A6H1UDU3_9GAMM|nr:rhodanese-like domain-containing protein [Ferrimonas lipolytica]QIZ77277.1 rhodanese-like domain-containing protein [Ferrimonas lipolytica]